MVGVVAVVGFNWFDGFCVCGFVDGFCVCGFVDGLMVCVCVCVALLMVCVFVCVVMGLDRMIGVSWVCVCGSVC